MDVLYLSEILSEKQISNIAQILETTLKSIVTLDEIGDTLEIIFDHILPELIIKMIEKRLNLSRELAIARIVQQKQKLIGKHF